MRALVVHPGPQFSVADVHNGWVKGLRQCGVEVDDFALHERLNFFTAAELTRDGETRRAFSYEAACDLAAETILTECYRFWPDLVIVVSGFYVPPEVYAIMRDRGHHVVLLCTESPYEDARQAWMAPAAHTVLLNDPTNLGAMRERNPRTFYVPHGYDPDLHRPGPVEPDLTSDFCFVGTGYPSRVAFLEQVDWTGLNVRLEGNWEQVAESSPIRPYCPAELTQCIDNPDAVRMYRSTKVSANLYRREAMAPDLSHGWACGPREIELAASGTFFLREPRGESDELFPSLPTFTDPGELGDLVRWWASHDSEREEAAVKARLAVQDRTFEANARRLLQLISG